MNSTLTCVNNALSDSHDNIRSDVVSGCEIALHVHIKILLSSSVVHSPRLVLAHFMKAVHLPECSTIALY